MTLHPSVNVSLLREIIRTVVHTW